MKLLFSTLILLVAQFLSGITVSGQGFNKLLKEVAGTDEKDKVISEYIYQNNGLPILEGDTVIFMAWSPLQEPKVLSGFNGFLSPRYISDSTAGAMLKIEGSQWYYLKKRLEIDARIFYQFYRNEQPYNDPLNQSLGRRFGMINSEFRMPEFKIHEELVQDQFIPAGDVIKTSYYSNALKQERTIHVYLPADYQASSERYASAYFHDGSDYVSTGKVPQILDYLIAHQKIKPLIAVFDDPITRGKEYRGDPAYIEYINNELTTFVDSNYRAVGSAASRAVIGGSRGALSSLILSHSGTSFSKCGTFSPAVHPREIQEFISFLTSAKSKPLEVVVIGAIYDKIWYPDALALNEYFSDQNITFEYLEISQGHNIESWVNYLDDILINFFPN